MPKKAAIAAVLALVLAPPALAAPAKMLGRFADWEAYTYTEGNGRVCYAASVPKSSEGAARTRGQTLVTITHRSTAKSGGVFSVTAGYAYKKGSEPVAEVDGAKFKLYADADTAWAHDDKPLVAAMMRGTALVVRGFPASGAPTVDTYSLNGLTAALAEIGKACGVK